MDHSSTDNEIDTTSDHKCNRNGSQQENNECQQDERSVEYAIAWGDDTDKCEIHQGHCLTDQCRHNEIQGAQRETYRDALTKPTHPWFHVSLFIAVAGFSILFLPQTYGRRRHNEERLTKQPVIELGASDTDSRCPDNNSRNTQTCSGICPPPQVAGHGVSRQEKPVTRMPDEKRIGGTGLNVENSYQRILAQNGSFRVDLQDKESETAATRSVPSSAS